MNLRKRSLIAFTVIAILASVSGALWHTHRKSNSNIALPHINDTKGTQLHSPSTTSYASLVAAKRVDTRFIEPLGTRAFTIARHGDFRPAGDAKQFVLSRLRDSDNGDSTATYEIYLATLDCRNAGSPAELQSARLLSNASDQKTALESSERRLDECSSLMADPSISSPGRWLLKAAQQGSIEAALLYSIDTESAFGGSAGAVRDPQSVIEWKSNASSFLTAAANSGSVDAVIALARANENGVIVDRNPTEAYAYFLAARRVVPVAAPDALLGRYKKELSAAQQQAALSRADAIYQSCCQ